jgi:CDP-diacylglycerol---glycerol-3-phosphate 3-phosphatidyltransferase
MPSIYDLKPKFQNLLRPIVRKLAAVGISANQITIMAMILSFTVGGLIYLYPKWSGLWLAVPVTLFLRMALNAIDGMLAREHDMKSPLGGILNELGDVLSDAVLYLPFAVVVGINPALVVLVVTLAIISEMTGVIAIQIGASRRYDGPMGKSDRAFVFGALGLILGFGYSPAPWVNYVFIVVLILLFMTVFNRAKRALEEIR